jgi:hypothetical protein
MKDVLLSSTAIIDRLSREEQQLKSLGLHAQAAGIRTAITAVIRLTQEEPLPDPPLESTE